MSNLPTDPSGAAATALAVRMEEDRGIGYLYGNRTALSGKQITITLYENDHIELLRRYTESVEPIKADARSEAIAAGALLTWALERWGREEQDRQREQEQAQQEQEQGYSFDCAALIAELAELAGETNQC